jgi:hypothetical protein
MIPLPPPAQNEPAYTVRQGAPREVLSKYGSPGHTAEGWVG